MKKLIIGVATVIAAVLLSGCNNYKKMAQENPVDYLSIASKNTFGSISEKDILDITSHAYNAMTSGTVKVSVDADSFNAAFSSSSDSKGRNGYKLYLSDDESFVDGSVYIGKDSIDLSLKNEDGSYAYTVPYDKFDSRFRNSIWGADSDTDFSLSDDEEEAIIDYIDQLRDHMNKKGDFNFVKQIKKLKSEFEETEVTASDGTYDAYVISYNLSDDDLIELIENISDDSIDDELYDEIIDIIREYELSLKLSFEVNKKTNTIISVSGKIKGNDNVTLTVKADFGGNPEKVDEYTFKILLSDEYESISINASFLTEIESKTSEIYTFKIKYEDKYESYDIKFKTEYDKKSHEFSTKFTMSDGSDSVDAKLSGTVDAGKKNASITINDVGGKLKELLGEFIDETDDCSISFTFSDDPDIEKIKGDDLLNISEDDFSEICDSIAESLEDILGDSEYVMESDVSYANASAKQIHTASASSLTQLGISNFDFGYSDFESYLTFNGVTDGVIKISWGGITNKPSDYNCDLVAYLGEDYEGYAYAVFDPYTYSVKYALWSSEPIPEKYLHQLNEDEIKQSRREGSVVGCYPILY